MVEISGEVACFQFLDIVSFAALNMWVRIEQSSGDHESITIPSNASFGAPLIWCFMMEKVRVNTVDQNVTTLRQVHQIWGGKPMWPQFHQHCGE